MMWPTPNLDSRIHRSPTMSHPLETVMRQADGFVLIGDSTSGRFPAFSYAVYSRAQKPFYCLDLGGLSESRGPVSGGKVYTSVADLPAEHGDLAVVWMTPKTAVTGVEAAAEAGCRRIWFSFKTGHVDAVKKARELGMEVVEIGRCPVYYMDDKPLTACKVHTRLVKLSGTFGRPPQLEASAKRRELL